METKICSKCKVEKSLTFFNKRTASKDGDNSVEVARMSVEHLGRVQFPLSHKKFA